MILAIVDDDDDVRRALSRLLTAMGHEVKVFPSAEEFEADACAADCVIIDVRLPGLGGVELGERLRNRPTSLPVVLITGDREPLARPGSHSIELPVVTKPFEAAVLTAAIAQAIATTRLLDHHAL